MRMQQVAGCGVDETESRREILMDDTVSRTLKEFYDFDDADLEANRDGKLTEKQLRMMTTRNNAYRRVGYGGGGFFLGMAVLIALIWFIVFAFCLLTNNWSGFQGASIGAGISVPISGVVGGLVLRYGLSKSNPKFVLKKTEGPVVVDEGNVQGDSETSSSVEHHMTIDGVQFVLDDELVGVIKADEVYAIYYLDLQDGSEGLILSLERIS